MVLFHTFPTVENPTDRTRPWKVAQNDPLVKLHQMAPSGFAFSKLRRQKKSKRETTTLCSSAMALYHPPENDGGSQETQTIRRGRGSGLYGSSRMTAFFNRWRKEAVHRRAKDVAAQAKIIHRHRHLHDTSWHLQKVASRNHCSCC